MALITVKPTSAGRRAVVRVVRDFVPELRILMLDKHPLLHRMTGNEDRFLDFMIGR